MFGIGIVAEVVGGHCRQARPETGAAPDSGNLRVSLGGMGRRVSLVLARLGGVRRRSGGKDEGEADGAIAISLTGSDAMDAPLSSCRRSSPYPTGAAAQGRIDVLSITTRCRNIATPLRVELQCAQRHLKPRRAALWLQLRRHHAQQ